MYSEIHVLNSIIRSTVWRAEPDENKRKRVISPERIEFPWTSIQPVIAGPGRKSCTQREEEGKRLDYHWRRILTATLAGHRTIYQPSWPAHTGMPHDCHYLRCHRVIYTWPFDYRVEPLAIFFSWAKICRMDRGQVR